MTRTLENLGGEIERRWAQLGAAPTNDDLKVVDLPQQISVGRMLLGVGRDGSRLLVPLAPDAHRSFRPDKRSGGVNLLLRSLEQDGGNQWFLDVVCVRNELRWLFSTFVADVLLRFERHPDVEPATIVRTCFSSWKSLFTSTGRRMTMKQLAGLYGELHVLDRLLDLSELGTSCWKGPLRAPHDFVGASVDIEVKTTLSEEDNIVYIHGVEQLSVRAESDLYLAHLRVETPSPEGESLGEIVVRLEDRDRSGKLRSMLIAAGYQDAERQAHSSLTFRLVDEQWYAVIDGFPRLTAETFAGGNVPPGLGDFRYTIDLSAATATPLSQPAIAVILASVVE